MAEALANQVGKKIPLASADPRAARIPMMPDGKMARPAVLMARNSTIALVAVPIRLLYLFSSSIALIPNGVAALPRPRMLAEMFRTIALMAGLPVGTVGKSSRMTGLTAREMLAINPASEATRIKPRKNAMIPISPIARSTASRADVMIASVNGCIWLVTAAKRTEASAMKTKRPLIMDDDSTQPAGEDAAGGGPGLGSAVSAL